MNESGWKFHWLTRWDEIWDAGFVRQWQTWMDQSPSAHVFFHPALVKAWVDTYLPLRDINPYFLIAESGNGKVFLPLLLWKRNWKNAFQKLLIPVGYSDFDYHDPIIIGADTETFPDMDAFWTRLLQSFRAAGNPVCFDCFSQDGIRNVSAGQEKGRWRLEDSCPWIDLRPFEKPEDFLPSLKINMRKDLRRQMRRFEEIGEFQHIVCSSDMKEAALRELPSFLDAHSKHWPGAYKAPHFHENLVRNCLKENLLYFCILKTDGISAAWEMSFIYRKHFYGYLYSYDDKFLSYSPGKIIFLKSIEDAILRKLSVYDCLRGEESYKSGWTDKKEPIHFMKMEGDSRFSKIRNFMVDRIKPMLRS